MLNGCAYKNYREAFYQSILTWRQRRRRSSVLQLEQATPAGWDFRICVFHVTPTQGLLWRMGSTPSHDNEVTKLHLGENFKSYFMNKTQPYYEGKDLLLSDFVVLFS